MMAAEVLCPVCGKPVGDGRPFVFSNRIWWDNMLLDFFEEERRALEVKE